MTPSQKTFARSSFSASDLKVTPLCARRGMCHRYDGRWDLDEFLAPNRPSLSNVHSCLFKQLILRDFSMPGLTPASINLENFNLWVKRAGKFHLLGPFDFDLLGRDAR